MNFVYSLIITLILLVIGFLGTYAPYVFAVVIPYAAFIIFVGGLVFRINKWAHAPVPFREPTVCGQQKSLPWIKSNNLESPHNIWGVLGRMFLEVVFSEDFTQILFRSSVFILVLVFSIFLLKSVRKEVALREKVEVLAKSLEKANIRLKELDKLKSEFVSFATHQIRAPLTAIKGYTSLIQEGSYGDVSQEVKGAVDKISQASHSLVLVVEDYLNISRIEMGRMKYNFAITDL